MHRTRFSQIWFPLLAWTVIAATPVRALTDKQVLEKLNSVPAFTILTKEGRFLLGQTKSKDGKEDVPLVVFFTDSALAQKSFDEFKKKAPPDVAKEYQLIPVGLGIAFEQARTAKQDKDNKVVYYFPPNKENSQKALILAKKIEPKLTEFPGIPVFFLGKDGQPTITINRGTEQLLPFYLSEQDIQQQWEQLKKSKPDLVDKAEVQVASLDNILSFMIDPKNEKAAQSITFVPDVNALKFVDTIQKTLPSSFKTAPTPGTTPPTAKPTETPPAEKPTDKPPTP